MPKRKNSSRGYSLRKINTREVKQRFLIVCEGEKTEPKYFESFRVPKKVVEIDVKGIGKNPSQLVDIAIKLKEQEDYDQVWCVFDRDCWTLEDFNKAIQKAEAQNKAIQKVEAQNKVIQEADVQNKAIQNADTKRFRVAYSNEAFELWYVLHFEFLNTGIPRKDYCKKLTSLLGRPYQKNSETIYDELLDKQPTAIKNAEKLLKCYVPPNPGTDNPSTTVHELVQKLNKFL